MKLPRHTLWVVLLCTGGVAGVLALPSTSPPEEAASSAKAMPRIEHRARTESAPPVIDVEKLARRTKTLKSINLFPVPTQPVQASLPPAPPPVAVPAAAPPLPFIYQGRFQDETGKTVIYLSKDDQAYSVSQGDLIDSNYKIDSVGAASITITYLPMNVQQTLPIEPAS